ncbi:DUF1275 domain-containing protein [Sphingomonas sp. BN140010]|uniref:DUF1275 domain-containing protein n=1 Tax=Sphingomonas arvum TaxID=2992113 RepID=A0ABT3JDS1_9SPHN|nr:YoaK family protein [Sphingomonas sp. BN140010]MCW3797214.1 DUF1275 domain-containing protein [Sphingomonas sp. BN140010]
MSDTPTLLGQRAEAFFVLAVAGWTDGAGFLLFAGIFVSFMSGDTTQLAAALSVLKLAHATTYLLPAVVFVFGAMLGRLLQSEATSNGNTFVFGLTSALLFAAALLGSGASRFPALLCALVAMGMLNAPLHEVNRVPVGTMVTGALVRLGQALADRLQRRPGNIADNAGQWLFFVTGAVAGCTTAHALGAVAFLFPAIGSALLIPARLRSQRQAPLNKGGHDHHD